MQNNILFSTPTTNDGILEYDASSGTFIYYDKIYDDQSNLIYQTPSGSGDIKDMKINSSTQSIIMTFNSTIGMIDFSGSNFTALGVASQYITSVAVFSPGTITTNNTNVTSFIPSVDYFYIEQVYDIFDLII